MEWLGEVPAHWVELPLKTVTSYNDDVMDEAADADQDQDILYVDISSVDRAVGIVAKESMPFSAAPSRARRKVKHGDVIVSTVRTYLRAIARIVEPEKNLVVSTGFTVIRPSDRIFHGFLGYLLSAKFFVDEVISKSVGVSYPAINASDLVSIKVPVPSIKEQQTIATFLDRETGKTDALIAEQRHLVELLAEKRQAVISHAVTKGLNHNAPMKDSGIEWLGEVPAHWAVVPIKAVATLTGRIGYRGYTTADIVNEGEGAITLSPSNMGDGNISLNKCTYISWDKYHESPEIKVSCGDVIMVKTGSTFGKVALVRQNNIPEMTINPQLVIFKQVACNPIFLFFSLYSSSIQAEIKVSNTGGTIPTMTQECIGNFALPLPTSEEQSTIATFLDNETAKFDALTAEANCAIALLQERRSALISAAVTGKIDVRKTVMEGT